MLKRTIVSFITVAAMSSAAFGAGIGDTGFYGGLGLGRSDSDANAGASPILAATPAQASEYQLVSQGLARILAQGFVARLANIDILAAARFAP